MFSPMVAISCVSSSATDLPEPGRIAALIASTSSPTLSATWATLSTNAWKLSLRATKSVSAFTSTIAATCGPEATPTSPSAATRPDFFAAAARPFLRSQSIACSTSPPVSPSAFLQSIMPAPVFSRRSFTRAAVISAILLTPSVGAAPSARRRGAPLFVQLVGTPPPGDRLPARRRARYSATASGAGSDADSSATSSTGNSSAAP